MTAQSRHKHRSFDDLLSEMTFDFFGSGQHRVTGEQLLSQSNGVLLDVRSMREVQALSLTFTGEATVLHIPTNEIPDRWGEIPTDRPVAVFCSAGTRAAIVYAYLRMMGFEQVRILVGGLTEQASLHKIWARSMARRQSS